MSDIFEDDGRRTALGPIHPNTPAEKRAARLAICAAAVDVKDARELLDMLGLIER